MYAWIKSLSTPVVSRPVNSNATASLFKVKFKIGICLSILIAPCELSGLCERADRLS